MRFLRLEFALAALLVLAPVTAASRPAMPRYEHIFVIVEENKGFNQIMGHPTWTPVIHRLASEYGLATQFYAEVHPSEANYIAMVGGDTFGIHDDDAFYCKPRMKDPFCDGSNTSGYVDHDLTAPSLMDQLARKGLTWKGYMEDIPSAGSLVPRWPTPAYRSAGKPSEMYAAKHNPFVNFRSVNREPFSNLERHLVGFHQLDGDLAADKMPNYALIIPNQCNEMHGSDQPDAPAWCKEGNDASVIRRGDAEIGILVDKVMHSKVWSAAGNSAIVVTFDENDEAERHSGVQGCCGYDPHSKANFGGGHIVTIVITNHGAHHVTDPTPYNHYSLLRTTEDAFGINEHLRHAADTAKGVVTMARLFAVAR